LQRLRAQQRSAAADAKRIAQATVQDLDDERIRDMRETAAREALTANLREAYTCRLIDIRMPDEVTRLLATGGQRETQREELT
jgi:hypothetical protein